MKIWDWFTYHNRLGSTDHAARCAHCRPLGLRHAHPVTAIATPTGAANSARSARCSCPASVARHGP